MQLIIPKKPFNLTEYCLAKRVGYKGQHLALILVNDCQVEERWTYESLYQRILCTAGGLEKRKLPNKSRILIHMSNDIHSVCMFFGAIAAGLIPVPLSPQLTEPEFLFIVQDTEAEIAVFSQDIPSYSFPVGLEILDLKGIIDLVNCDPFENFQTVTEDPAFLIYTSGTTGKPKGVLHAHRSVLGRIPMRRGWTGIESRDRVLHTGQLNWTYTLGVGLMDTWTAGATSILYEGTRSAFVWLPMLEVYEASIFVAVPSIYRQIIKYQNVSYFNTSYLRHCLAAGEPLSASLAEEWKDLVGVDIYEALGMSEISTYISSGPTISPHVGSPGRPQSGRKVAILPLEEGTEHLPLEQVGLLAVHRSDPGLMLGYWNRSYEEANCFRGEWFIGGDMAKIDQEGYVWYEGRNDDMINSFGYRISPIEVERVLCEHPQVSEAAVSNIPLSSENKLIMTAFIVPHSQGQLDGPTILKWTHKRLAHYKCPKEVRFVNELPTTRNGKLQRKKLVNLVYDNAS